MKLATIREQRSGRQRLDVPTGPRSQFFYFECDISHDPTDEGVRVQPGPDLWKWHGVRWCWPYVVAAFEDGCRRLAENAVRLCCTHIVISSAKYHDVYTSEWSIRRCVDEFVSGCLREWAKPLNPFPTECLSSTVADLARGIHADSAFDRLPILSDALQDAGCTDPLVIAHLQMCPDHGTSCWVVEMILDQLATK
jgi:hypothetical protein